MGAWLPVHAPVLRCISPDSGQTVGSLGGTLRGAISCYVDLPKAIDFQDLFYLDIVTTQKSNFKL